MQISLAPMEGVADYTMRQLLTGVGGIDQCTTEFVRVKDHTLPRRVFIRYSKELLSQGKTTHGTPVHLQLLGGDPEALAGNAEKAAKLGAPCIDLNFGCPAKTVNRHDGGAKLLQEPERIFRIVQAVRKKVPTETPVTAKIRLGYHDKSLALENAMAVQEGGANAITIHGRTKLQGYQPPADWQTIGKLNSQLKIPVTANGEIWTPEDYWQCREQSGCDNIMIGRGLLANPFLALEIKQQIDQQDHWPAIIPLLVSFLDDLQEDCQPRYQANLIKQWLMYLGRHFPQAGDLFATIKRLKDPEQVYQALGALPPQQRSAASTNDSSDRRH